MVAFKRSNVRYDFKIILMAYKWVKSYIKLGHEVFIRVLVKEVVEN